MCALFERKNEKEGERRWPCEDAMRGQGEGTGCGERGNKGRVVERHSHCKAPMKGTHTGISSPCNVRLESVSRT